jgi:hypothetical protein
MDPEVELLELKVTVLIQAANRVGSPTAMDSAVYVVTRVEEVGLAIHPPNANPDFTMVPTVGRVRD